MNQVSLVPPDRMGAGIDPGTPNEQAVRPPAPDSNGFIFWLDEPQSWPDDVTLVAPGRMVFARQRSPCHHYAGQNRKPGIRHPVRDFAARCDRFFWTVARE